MPPSPHKNLGNDTHPVPCASGWAPAAAGSLVKTQGCPLIPQEGVRDLRPLCLRTVSGHRCCSRQRAVAPLESAVQSPVPQKPRARATPPTGHPGSHSLTTGRSGGVPRLPEFLRSPERYPAWCRNGSNGHHNCCFRSCRQWWLDLRLKHPRETSGHAQQAADSADPARCRARPTHSGSRDPVQQHY